ncbi:MAG: glycosyltransferase [Thermoguttaceae bacterium]|nr:glycosyltransferase [Thermoguttaceae bacterium]
MENERIQVSVLCLTYNHEKYIRDALEGFVSQKTNFPFEVLVHDDASTDGTADIIREYERRYPEIIRGIYQTENKYSTGCDLLQEYVYPLIRGKYIAFCEGDDYWTVPYKLQKQFDALEAHPEVDICAHAVRVIKNGKPGHPVAPADHDTLFSVEEVIEGEGGFVGTASLMYRTEIVLHPHLQFPQIYYIDYAWQISGSLRGGMLYLNDIMAVYRYAVTGSWTQRTFGNPEKRIAHIRRVHRMLAALNEETGFQYNRSITRRQEQNRFDLLKLQRKWGEMKRACPNIYGEQPLTKKIKITGRAYCSRFLEILFSFFALPRKDQKRDNQ